MPNARGHNVRCRTVSCARDRDTADGRTMGKHGSGQEGTRLQSRLGFGWITSSGRMPLPLCREAGPSHSPFPFLGWIVRPIRDDSIGVGAGSVFTGWHACAPFGSSPDGTGGTHRNRSIGKNRGWSAELATGGDDAQPSGIERHRPRAAAPGILEQAARLLGPRLPHGRGVHGSEVASIWWTQKPRETTPSTP